MESDPGRRQRVGINELSRLLNSTRILSESMDVEAVLREVVEAAAGLVASDSGRPGPRASIVAYESGSISPLFEHDGVDDLRGQTFPVEAHPAAARAIAAGGAATCVAAELLSPFDEISRRDGWVSMACAPITVAGELYGLLFAVTRHPHQFDDSELRLLEGMADLAGLAVANAERTRELTQLEHAKSEFLRLASHELRAPLTVLRGYLSMLEGGHIPTEQLQALVPLFGRRVEEMNALVDGMVDFASLEDSKLQIKPRACDVAEALGEVVERARADLTPAHSIALSTADRPIDAWADPDRLRTILVNLVGNAIKYSPAGGEVRCQISSAEGFALIDIHDSGIGIDADGLSQLFGRFSRLGSREHPEIPGLGLGLYLSRELARLHGGDLTVTSEPGVGSCFRLAVPLAV